MKKSLLNSTAAIAVAALMVLPVVPFSSAYAQQAASCEQGTEGCPTPEQLEENIENTSNAGAGAAANSETAPTAADPAPEDEATTEASAPAAAEEEEAAEPEAEAASAVEAELPETDTQEEEAPTSATSEPEAVDAEPSDAGSMAEPAEPTETEVPAAEPATTPEVDTATATESVTATDPEAEPKPDEQVTQDDTETSIEEANATPEVAASAEAAAQAEVETITVTDEDVRSSSEGFQARTVETANESDGGLSNLEKFAIGAVGVGALAALIGENDKVVENTGDRVVVQRQDGQYYILKDDDVLIRRPGSTVETQRFSDGSTTTTVTREDGSQIVTIKAGNGQVLRRTKVLADGTSVVLFDDTAQVAAVQVSSLPAPRDAETFASNGDLEAALNAVARGDAGRTFSLQQVRQIRSVRTLMPEIQLEAVNFPTGSAAIPVEEAEELTALGTAMRDFIADNPGEVFLIEGHTDAVGNATYNLALSDRRAESVALALTEYFDVPPENMVVQGYGEANLKIRTAVAEQANRRAVVRRITPLLR